MSISLGGLGLVSLRDPFADLPALISGRGDLRLVLCLIVFAIVSLVLAYLTNPSEISFRAYLTEQSFRHHLRRLDAHPDEPSPLSPQWQNRQKSTPSTFHFATRASISLRTPKHVFHSFAIFTIAAMAPLPRQDQPPHRSQDAWLISDSWYIGAFGKWWRGGRLEAWYHDLINRGKDEEIWSSGILSMKRLDTLGDYRMSLFHPALAPMSIQQDQADAQGPQHDSQPIPMRPTLKRPVRDVTPNQSCPSPPRSSEPRSSDLPSSPLPLKPSASVENMPLVSEIMQQITDGKASVNELRVQLTDFQSSASRSHALLQTELDQHRLRKRQDEASRTELRTQMKALEDAKRSTEALKRGAEKKRKSTQARCQDTAAHVRALDAQIADAGARLADDDAFISDRQRHPVPLDQQELKDELASHKLQAKLLEGTVASLNQRTRKLEERLSIERGRLQQLREQRIETLNNAHTARHGDSRPYLQVGNTAQIDEPMHRSQPIHGTLNLDLYSNTQPAKDRHAQPRISQTEVGSTNSLCHPDYSVNRLIFPGDVADPSIVRHESVGPAFPSGLHFREGPPRPFLRHSPDTWTSSAREYGSESMFQHTSSWQPHVQQQVMPYHLPVGVDVLTQHPSRHSLYGLGEVEGGKETSLPPSPRDATLYAPTGSTSSTNGALLPPTGLARVTPPLTHAFAPSPAEQVALNSLATLKIEPKVGTSALSHLPRPIQQPSLFVTPEAQVTNFSPWDDDDEVHGKR